MWALYLCFHLCLVFAVICPEVILASFLYSVSYHAHGGAIVVVFVSGSGLAQDRGKHKGVMHRTATSKHHCFFDF